MARRVVPALLVAALVSAALVATPGSAAAAAGDLDPSFGTAGVATAPPSGTLPNTGANALAIDSAGRIVTAGSVHDTSTSQDVFTVHRFLPTGAIDSSFGTGGLAVVPITTGWSINIVTGVGVQPDGRIVVGARVYQTSDTSNAKYAVVGLTSSGALDTDFDGGVAGNGILLLTVGPVLPPAPIEVERKLQVDESGRILISGLSYYTAPTSMHATMARLAVDGTFDPTFSGDGRFDLPLPTTASDMKAFADLPGADGYALGGYTNPNTGPTIGQPTIVRVSETGDLVTGFGSSLSSTPGMSTQYWQGDPTRLGEITSLAGLPGGSLVAGGYQNPGQAALAKYTSTGALDPAFGGGGVALLQIGGGPTSVNDLVLQPDGKILAAMYGGPGQHGFVARFTALGTLDPTFGTSGTVEVDPVSSAPALALQGDGKAVAIARRGQPDTTLVRLLADPPPPAPVPPTTPTPGPALPTPTTPVAAPTIRLTAPAAAVKAKRLKALAGTAGPAGSVARVQVAVQRVDKRLLRSRHRCLWLANHRGVFTKVKATRRGCTRPLYRPASGTTAWRYALRRTLPPGAYVVLARVRLDDGRTATVRRPVRLRR